MRILHILDHSLPLHSGYAFRTVAILREQRALGWTTFQVTTPRHGRFTSDSEAVDEWSFFRTSLGHDWVGRVPFAGPYLAEMMSTADRIEDLVRQVRPDVMHAHSPVLTVLPALWVARRHGVPVIYEVRALWEDGAVDHGTTQHGSPRYRLTRAIETFALRHADRVTTICEGLRNEIATRGVPSARISVIPNAVDCDAFGFDPPPDAELRARLGLEDKVVLGYFGSFYGYEGLELLVESFALLCARRPDLRLLLAGGGVREQAVRDRVAALGLADRVILAGRVPHEEVQRYYSVVDVMVYPRLRVRVTELVTPLKPLEAMAQGRLVLASDVGGHRELVRDGDTGYLFAADDPLALADKVETMLDQREHWPGIRQRARRFVETERTWKASVARYVDVYRNAAGPVAFGQASLVKETKNVETI